MEPFSKMQVGFNPSKWYPPHQSGWARLLQWKDSIWHSSGEPRCYISKSTPCTTGFLIHWGAMLRYTKGKMLLQWGMSTVKDLVQDYELSVDMLVASNQNLADGMTKVPQKFFKMAMERVEHKHQMCIFSQIMGIHHSSEYLGLQCTIYFVSRICPSTSKQIVKSALNAKQ